MGLDYGNRSKGIYGVGINDLDYDVAFHDKETGKMVWKCPFYTKWYSMMNRCYSTKYKSKGPTYLEASVHTDWIRASVFRNWMYSYKWEGMQLDKDILIPGNKVYGPDTCSLVPRYINNLLCDHRGDRGNCPLGTNWHKATEKYCASVSEFGKRVHIGVFHDMYTAHRAWQWKKAEVIEKAVTMWKSSGCESFRTDVAEALLLRAWNLRLQFTKHEETKNFQ